MLDDLYEASSVMILVERVIFCRSARKAIGLLREVAQDAYNKGFEDGEKADASEDSAGEGDEQEA